MGLRPVSIAVAPNGGRRTKEDHPALAMSAQELAETASRCLDAGASMIHVHARDRDGRHILDADAYRDIIRAISAAVGDKLVVQITSESLGIYEPAQQMHVLKNPGAPDGSPWYPANFEGDLVTPEWTFAAGSLRRWP